MKFKRRNYVFLGLKLKFMNSEFRGKLLLCPLLFYRCLSIFVLKIDCFARSISKRFVDRSWKNIFINSIPYESFQNVFYFIRKTSKKIQFIVKCVNAFFYYIFCTLIKISGERVNLLENRQINFQKNSMILK